jgi:hypothetical protein
MPTGQQYGTNVSQTVLTTAITSTANSFVVNSSTSWPATPFTAVFGIGTSTQEAFDVTNVTGNTWTVTRGIDGTLAQNQPQNQTITHADIGRDFREARSHIDASGGTDASGHNVHGISTLSQVVGTQDTQTLLAKTLSGPTLQQPVITNSVPIGAPANNLALYSNASVLTSVDNAGVSNSLQPPLDGPYLNKAIAWTMDPCQASSSNTPSSGAISINLVYVNYLATVTNFLCSVQTAGSGLTAGQNLVGVYNLAGTRVGISADQTAAWGSTGNKTAALTMTGPLEPGYYYLAFLTVGTTPPKFYGGSAVSTVQNINFASAPYRFSFLSGQTSLPTTITPSSFFAAGFIPLALIA